jgi:hypothetical protein
MERNAEAEAQRRGRGLAPKGGFWGRHKRLTERRGPGAPIRRIDRLVRSRNQNQVAVAEYNYPPGDLASPGGGLHAEGRSGAAVAPGRRLVYVMTQAYVSQSPV